MTPQKVVVSAEGNHVVIYAQIGNIIVGIQLSHEEALRVGDDLLDRARIIERNLWR